MSAALTPEQRARLDDPIGSAIMALYLDLKREAALVYAVEHPAFLAALAVRNDASMRGAFRGHVEADQAAHVVLIALARHVNDGGGLEVCVTEGLDDNPAVRAARIRLHDAVAAARAAVEKARAGMAAIAALEGAPVHLHDMGHTRCGLNDHADGPLRLTRWPEDATCPRCLADTERAPMLTHAEPPELLAGDAGAPR